MGIRDLLRPRRRKETIASSSSSVLTEVDRENFRTHGFIHLRGCFSAEQARSITDDVWTRLEMDPNDRTTWTAMWTAMPHHRTFDASEFAPRAWAAICELCGGEERVSPHCKEWRDALIVNLGTPDLEGVDIPPHSLDGWHVDGDFFVHYLDSPEQGLLVVPLFTNILPGGGGAVICPDAIPKIAKHLHDNPAGVSPKMAPRGHPAFSREKDHAWLRDTAESCSSFVEIVGDCGDVFLLHPLMLHTLSTNPRRQLSVIINPQVSLKEPFRFDRPDGNYSVVEQATLRALGRDKLVNWRITSPRETIAQKRVRTQARSRG